MHKHRAQKGKDQIRGWSHCVTSCECAANPARQQAHGNIIVIDHCACGATRESESNGGKVNYGYWITAEVLR